MMADEMDAVRARFDRVAAEYDSVPHRVALARGVAAAIRQAVPLRADMRAMDFGAGTGLLTLGLLPYVSQITAVDTSPEMIRVLQQKLDAQQITNARTLLCDVATGALPVAEFDLVVSSMVLHHIPNVPQALRRLRPCLRPGGWIALADLDSEDGTFHPDPSGVFHHGFARSEVCRWLQQAGFTETSSCDAHQMARPSTNGEIRQYPVFLVTARAG
jgi:tRNA (cmo5U34)-methyltransferase